MINTCWCCWAYALTVEYTYPERHFPDLGSGTLDLHIDTGALEVVLALDCFADGPYKAVLCAAPYMLD
jgi:hypothetical protein